MWEAWNTVTLKLRKPIDDVVKSGIAANRQRIKETLPPDEIGGSNQVLELDNIVGIKLQRS